MPKKPREIVRAYLALGSNLGDRASHIRNAARELGQAGTVVALSPLFETAPIGPPQGAYLNACAALDTQLSPEALLAALLEIEQAHDRTRTERWGPRTLDLDILLYGDLQLHTATLTVPHPALHLRGFVLAPLNTIAAEQPVPGIGKTVARLWHDWQAADGQGVRPYE